MLNKVVSLFAADMAPEERAVLTRHGFRLFLLVHVVWACGWLAPFGLIGFAQAGEVAQVKRELTERIDQVDKRLVDLSDQVKRGQLVTQRNALEQEIGRLDQEIFAIEARVQELHKQGLGADRIYSERLSQLRGERQKLESRLRAFLAANPTIASEVN